MNVWKDTGWGTILFLATLSGISPDLYEAAQIDGANRFSAAGMPFSRTPWGFLIVIILSVVASIIAAIFLSRKKFF